MRVIMFDDNNEEDYIYHRKLSIILSYLKNRYLSFDYIVWMDAGK